MSYPSIVALIPARGGSKRIPRKNVRKLGGIPLVQWTIRAAQESGIFDQIIVSTEDYGIAQLLMETSNCSVVTRSAAAAADDAPDYLWVKEWLDAQKELPTAFAILRPTSPFRTGETIRRAWQQFRAAEAHSLRAVEPVKQHPGKMWTWEGPSYPIKPLLDRRMPLPPYSCDSDVNPLKNAMPWHSCPTQTLPNFYIQNASLEIAWTYVLDDYGTISGNKVMPFFTEGYEGFDINTEEDWKEAERIVSTIGMAHA